MDWRGDEFLARVRARLAANLGEAAGIVADRIVESINGPYPPASSPGDPPHRRTGRLRASVASEVDADTLTAVVGAPGKVAYWLETGTRKMAARPFVRPALLNNLDQVRAAAAAGIGEAAE